MTHLYVNATANTEIMDTTTEAAITSSLVPGPKIGRAYFLKQSLVKGCSGVLIKRRSQTVSYPHRCTIRLKIHLYVKDRMLGYWSALPKKLEHTARKIKRSAASIAFPTP